MRQPRGTQQPTPVRGRLPATERHHMAFQRQAAGAQRSIYRALA